MTTTERAGPLRVIFKTPFGAITLEIYTEQAPLTARNFLRYVDEALYADATFYRAVRPDNGRRSHHFRLLQGGIDPTCRRAPLPPVPHEPTFVTGLRHLDGALAAVRWEPGTAASEFFIVIGDTPELDAGASCEEGFAVFGRVVSGMDIVRRINGQPTRRTSEHDYMKDQELVRPVPLDVTREPSNRPASSATKTSGWT